ncbi:MAG: hypothetical protein K0M56_00280 [Kaistella sp.]|nr:hypothetical protein [Kaistella sp.]
MNFYLNFEDQRNRLLLLQYRINLLDLTLVIVGKTYYSRTKKQDGAVSVARNLKPKQFCPVSQTRNDEPKLVCPFSFARKHDPEQDGAVWHPRRHEPE